MIHQPSVEIPRSVASDIMIKNKEMQDTKVFFMNVLNHFKPMNVDLD